jgi:hypothetical protein
MDAAKRRAVSAPHRVLGTETDPHRHAVWLKATRAFEPVVAYSVE